LGLAEPARWGIVAVVAVLGGCWEDRGSCELWQRKLDEGTEASTAIGELAKNRCVGARASLLAHLNDANLEADVLATLLALGRSPEAELAVRRSLGRGETVVVAAAQVTEWKLAAAEPELRAALADQSLAARHSELLAAALAVAPPARWIATLAREVGDEGPTMVSALALLAGVDWAGVSEPERVRAAVALSGLASRANVASEHSALALHALGRMPALADPTQVPLAERAAAGSHAALLAMWCIGQPEVVATARAAWLREGGTPELRALAAAIVAHSGAGAELEGLVAKAPAEAELAIGLALVGGVTVVAPLEARVAAEKGAARAAFSRALAFALPVDKLAAWEAELRASPSQMLRTIPDEPAMVAVLGRLRACGTDGACHATALEQALPALGRLDGELTVARAALKAAQDTAQAAVAADALRAQELAKATGGELTAAKQELEAIARRRDETYAGVGAAATRVAELEAVPLVAITSLRRLPPDDAARIARLVLTTCRGDACSGLRGWAAAAVSDRALACLLSTPEAP